MKPIACIHLETRNSYSSSHKLSPTHKMSWTKDTPVRKTLLSKKLQTPRYMRIRDTNKSSFSSNIMRLVIPPTLPLGPKEARKKRNPSQLLYSSSFICGAWARRSTRRKLVEEKSVYMSRSRKTKEKMKPSMLPPINAEFEGTQNVAKFSQL